MRGKFRRVVVVDFEYEIDDNGLPNILCMVAYVLDEHLRHVRTIRLWRGEFGNKPAFDIGPNTLFVAYSAWAELTCFLVLGWQFPVHIFDLHTAYLAVSNILLPYDPDEKRKRQSKNLAAACRAYGIEGWENVNKDVIAKDIGEGRWHVYGREQVIAYCEEDVSKSAELLRKMTKRQQALDVERILHWSNYSAKAIAQIQARGMPIDTMLWNLVQENKEAVVKDLLRRFDPSQGTDNPIYTLDGHRSYDRFERWLVSVGVTAWPRLESGKLDMDSDAFRLMYHVPGVENLHALHDSLRVIVGTGLPIGRDGRNRPSLFPFGTASGRNAHRNSLFNAHAGMRSFMVFPPGKVGVYLDWRTQEVGIAADLSNDEALRNAYRGGDVYHAFACDAGLTDDPDRKHWAKHSQTMRQRMKSLQLGINYGMGVPSLAKGLNRHPLIASNLVERHRRVYPKFWQWRDNQVYTALLNRKCETVYGWPLHISHSPNKRTLINFPCQGGGAEMLRLAAWLLCEAGIIPCMLIHDGILLELDDDGQLAQAIDIMRTAGRMVCHNLEIGVDIDQELRDGQRYRDKRPVARALWDSLVQTLQNVGALQDGCVA